MPFINFKTEANAEEKSLERHLEKAKKQENCPPSEEFFKLEQIRAEGEIKKAQNFDKLIDSEMKPIFGSAFNQAEELEFLSEQPSEQEIQNLKEDFEELEREQELGEPEPELVEFEEGF